MAAVAGYLLWTGADHNSSDKRGGECILIHANGLTSCDVEMINGRSACGVIRRRLQTSEGDRLSVLAFRLRNVLRIRLRNVLRLRLRNVSRLHLRNVLRLQLRNVLLLRLPSVVPFRFWSILLWRLERLEAVPLLLFDLNG